MHLGNICLRRELNCTRMQTILIIANYLDYCKPLNVLVILKKSKLSVSRASRVSRKNWNGPHVRMVVIIYWRAYLSYSFELDLFIWRIIGHPIELLIDVYICIIVFKVLFTHSLRIIIRIFKLCVVVILVCFQRARCVGLDMAKFHRLKLIYIVS